jgi:hypothetical protein
MSFIQAIDGDVAVSTCSVLNAELTKVVKRAEGFAWNIS